MLVKQKKNDSSTAFEPIHIKENNYVIVEPLTSTNAGNCQWEFAKDKHGEEYFIKKFLDPKYPDRNDVSEQFYEEATKSCQEWYDRHTNLYIAIKKSNEGNLITPKDLFKDGNHFYLITEKVKSNGISIEDIHKCSKEQQYILLKVLAYQFMSLAKNHVVHSDVKPENLLFKNTIGKYFTVKIIDFDAAFFETNIPEPNDLVGDMVYYSPETYWYIADEGETPELKKNITCKSDIFSLGIVFYQILCGKLPDYDKSQGNSLADLLINGGKIRINNMIDGKYRILLERMLEVDPIKRYSAQQVMKFLIQLDEYSVSPII
ncbi:MAG: protein kinase [Ruminococcus sp.]|nr:protein kinase [Ruminococcus sp.]